MPRLALVIVLGLLPSLASAAPCAGFIDVDDASGPTAPFCADVTWMKNRGITLGCAPNMYCPWDDVTRLQMAAFMHRLGKVTFQQGGNAFGGSAVLGTTDDQPLDIRVDGLRAMRFEPNPISPNVIGGSPSNIVGAGVRGATIAGGGVLGSDPDLGSSAPNRVTDAYGTVGGGYANRAGDDAGSRIDSAWATVGGGINNRAAGSAATVGGGAGNDAIGAASFIGSGNSNTASGFTSTIAGGASNVASSFWSTVGGGTDNTASGARSTVGGGSGNVAGGDFSTVPGGNDNIAAGYYSFAAGSGARANYAGCFVYADASSINPTSCFGQNEIVIRGLGGFYFWTHGSDDYTYFGARLAPATGAWATYSDRNGKERIDPVDVGAVLDKLVAMPIATWKWKGEPVTTRHMGPMAQDFHRAFGLGDRDTEIVTIDADGVAFAAIQGLNARVERQGAEIAALKAELAALRRRFDAPHLVAGREP